MHQHAFLRKFPASITEDEYPPHSRIIPSLIQGTFSSLFSGKTQETEVIKTISQAASLTMQFHWGMGWMNKLCQWWRWTAYLNEQFHSLILLRPSVCVVIVDLNNIVSHRFWIQLENLCPCQMIALCDMVQMMQVQFFQYCYCWGASMAKVL